MHQNKTSSKRFSYVIISHPSVIFNNIGVGTKDKYRILFSNVGYMIPKFSSPREFFFSYDLLETKSRLYLRPYPGRTDQEVGYLNKSVNTVPDSSLFVRAREPLCSLMI